MLAFLRRNAGSRLIKLLLGGVALSFVIGFGAISYLNRSSNGPSGPTADVVATVGDRPIPRETFLRQLERVRQNYTDQGLPADSEIFSSAFFLRSVLSSLVDQTVLRLSATDLGLSVSDAEVAEYIRSSGSFNEGGRFNKDRLLNYLRRAGISVEEFEESIRFELLGEKVSNLLQASVFVTEDEMWNRFRRDNEKVALRVVKVESKSLPEDAVSVTDEDLKTAYDADPEQYREPEKRRLNYFYLDTKNYMEDVEIPEDEILANYNANIAKFQTEEQVAFSRILFKFDAGDDASKTAARAKAEKVRDLARQDGADFAKLASENSDDAVTSAKGGDVGFKDRKGFPKELVEVAFGLADGAVSDLIETTRGFDVIKRTGGRPAGPRPYDEVKGQIKLELELVKAKEKIQSDIEAAYAKLAPGSDIRDFAEANDYEIGSTSLFGVETGPEGLEKAPQVGTLAFGMSKDEISKPFEGYSRWYVFQLAEIAESKLPGFDDAKDKVRVKVVAQKRAALAMEKAQAGLASIASGEKSLDQFASEIGATPIETGAFAASSRSVPKVGFIEGLTEAAFALPEGARFPSTPTPYTDGAVVFEVTSRTSAERAAFDAQKDLLRQSVLMEKRMQFISDWVDEHRDRYPVVENQAFWSRLAKDEQQP